MEGTITAPKKSDKAEKNEQSAARLPMNHPDMPHITINVQKGEGDDEKDAIYVGINGSEDFMVPRGVDVSVPVPVYEILMNAKRVHTSEDGAESFEANRFAITVVTSRRH